MAGERIGLLVGAAFGLVYVVVNAATLGGPVGVVLQVLGVAAFVGLLVRLRRPSPAGAAVVGGHQFGRGYAVVVAAEVAAGVAGIVLLNGPLDLPDGVLPWVTLVVGAHFVALARVWSAPSLAWLGAALALCGVVGLVVAASGGSTRAVAAVAGVLPGLLLLAGSWWAATRPAAPSA